MSLRDSISCTALGLRLGGGALFAIVTTPISPWAGLAAFGLWMLTCGPVLRNLVLPWLFPSARCPGCGRDVPLVGRWKCGSHYVDNEERHILQFRCQQGHRLEGFNCPRCEATILVQRGDRQMLRHGSAIRLKTTSNLPKAAGLLLGHDKQRRPIRLPDDRLAWHVAMTGGTGRGKSTLLCNLAVQLINRGDGLTILDPGGDLAKAVLRQVPPEREADVVYIDVSDLQHPFPLNILHAGSDLERAVLSEELLGVFHKLHGAAWGPLLAHQLRMALRSVMSVRGTLRDVYDMFVNGRTRTRIVQKLQDPALRAFWINEFPSIPAMRHSAVTNKLAPVVFHPVLGPIIGASRCLLDADRVIAERKIVLVNMATGSPAEDVTTLLGTFLVQKVIAAAFRQANLAEAQRQRHVLIVDEFQRFMHRAAAFDQILAEARKYRLSLIVANQFVEQLAPPVKAALFGNAGCLITFRVGHRDTRVLTPEFSGAVSPDLLELELGECLVRIGGDWTKICTPVPLGKPENDPTARIVEATRLRSRPTETAMTEAADDGGEAEAAPDFVS